MARIWSGAVTSRAWIWFIAAPRALRAEDRSVSRIRIDSTRPSRSFGVANPCPDRAVTPRLERVERVGFAAAAACAAVGLGDLENGHAGTTQDARQFGAVAAGALHRDRDDEAESAEIIDDLPVAGGGGAEFAVTEGSSVFVDDRDVMGVLVGVDSPGRC